MAKPEKSSASSADLLAQAMRQVFTEEVDPDAKPVREGAGSEETRPQTGG